MTRIYNVQFKKVLAKVKTKVLEVVHRVMIKALEVLHRATTKGIAEKKSLGISAAEKKEMNDIYNKIVGAPRDW